MNHYNIEAEALAIREEVIQKFPEYLDLLRSVRIRVSNRTTQALGVCRFKGGKPYEIVLSFAAYKHDENRGGLRNTMLHEIAHAIAGHAAGHGPVWRAAARKVGATPERCGTKLAVSPVTLVSIACYVCQGEIKVTPRRAAKAKRGERYRHTTCRPKGDKFYPFFL
jgi:hypothetical protein